MMLMKLPHLGTAMGTPVVLKTKPNRLASPSIRFGQSSTQLESNRAQLKHKLAQNHTKPRPSPTRLGSAQLNSGWLNHFKFFLYTYVQNTKLR